MALLLTLWTALPPTAHPGHALAEQQSIETPATEASLSTPSEGEPVPAPDEAAAQPEPEEAPTPSGKPTDIPTAAPTGEPVVTATAVPTGGPADTPAAEPTGEPAETPTTLPTGGPIDTPTAAPSPSSQPEATSSDAPAETPAVIPTDAPTETPGGETPAAWQVSPAEATYAPGSPDALTFTIAPPDAPFLGIEGLDCQASDGVVTIGAEAISSLDEGVHILPFLFADGVRIEVRLTVSPRMVTKGGYKSLFICGDTINSDMLAAGVAKPSQHWRWDADSGTLTLDGYSGGRIAFSGSSPMKVALASGSENTVASQTGDAALDSDSGLILTGGGTLNASSSGESTIASNRSIEVAGGTVRVSGGQQAFYSRQSGIRLKGGSVTVHQTGRQGAGFSTRTFTQVDGASVTVEGAGEAFDQLSVSAGSVTIRSCGTGASRGMSASGGIIRVEDISGSAAETDAGMSFSGCELTITGCGQYGLKTGQDLKIGAGANIQIEAGQVALYAPGQNGSIAIAKGANLDLNGGERAIQGTKVTINGKKYSGTYNHVIVRNGAVVKQENGITSLTVGGAVYGAASLSRDQSGAGWAWAAQTATLTLSGYGGAPVTANGGAIHLVLSGANSIEGALTLSGAMVSGDGSLSASRIVGAAGFEVRSGSVSAARLILSGGFSMSGGSVSLSGDGGPAVECKDFAVTGGALTLTNGDGLQPAGIRSSGKAAFRGGSVTVKGFGDFLSASSGVTVTGGSVWVGDGTGGGIASGGDIAVSGGSIWIKTARTAMSAPKGSILISKKPDLRLESASETAFVAKTVKISGKAYARRYPGVVILGGRLVEEYKLLPDLILAGQSYSMKQLNAGDFSGDGWSWSAKKNTLTLSGYRGSGIWINRSISLALAGGTESRGTEDYRSGSAAIYATENLTLTGSGRWSGGVYCAGKLTVSGSPILSAGVVRSGGSGVWINGGRVRATGEIAAESGTVSIQNSTVEAGRIDGARVTISKSSVFTTDEGDDASPDIRGVNGLTISSSIVFCTRFGAPHGKVSLSGSPVFRRTNDGGGVVWSLYGSASITRSMAVPPGRDCLVPAAGKLSISKGKKLYVYGSLRVDGKLTGAVVQRSEAGRIEIRGSAEIARGKSVRLSAVVLPVLPGGQADQTVSWVSGSPGLVRISDNGTATALAKAGEAAQITCSALDGSGVTATITLTVKEPASRIVLLRNGAPVARLSAAKSDGTLELDARVDPAGASGRVRWTSSNAAVALVDPEEGTVQLRKKGTATITCAAMDGTGVKAAVKLTIR